MYSNVFLFMKFKFGIFNVDTDERFILKVFEFSLNLDYSFIGSLKRLKEKVKKNLLELELVPLHMLWQVISIIKS